MKAYVITLKNNKYSQQVANRCVSSASRVGINVDKFFGVDKTESIHVMQEHGLFWSWAHNNTKSAYCPITGLKQTPYGASNKPATLETKIGCFMSHFLLWTKSVEEDIPLLILEHDAVFIRSLPEPIDFKGICQINDPAGATWKGQQWSQIMVRRGTVGVHEKTWITSDDERSTRPDGLAGNSAYLIKPWAAKELIEKTHELGIWPNDALMCKQLFPYLEEYYPFITKVEQLQSTSSR